jgi:4-alpha-glucanotransferase
VKRHIAEKVSDANGPERSFGCFARLGSDTFSKSAIASQSRYTRINLSVYVALETLELHLNQPELRLDPTASSVFPADYRASGILLHVTSLPSPHGIGGFGPEAIRWIDLIAEAGQTWWQILPIGPPDKGNSPYTPLSTFACNPLLISPESLIADGLLDEEACEVIEPFPEDHVDFDRVIVWKEKLLSQAYANFHSNRNGIMAKMDSEFRTFCEEQVRWLEDFALFVALKQTFKDANYVDWPRDFVQREKAVLCSAMVELAEQITRIKFDQFLVFKQLHAVRQHAANRGVKLFGDLPIFVSPDSSDVWSHPSLFLLDEDRRPKFAAGVPPDYFSETGQLWGNPLYDWAAHRRSGYAWWVDRLRSLMEQHDLVRLDHFRGFSAAWHVPVGEPTAVNGQWVEGPGADFFHEVKRALGGLPFVAEDLGTITDDVRALLAEFAFPKMGVLQFAFDGDDTNAFLPHHSVKNMVVYTGTHDNDTSLGWYRTLSEPHRECFWSYAKTNQVRVQTQDESEVPWLMLQLGWSTKAAIAISPMQDILQLGSEARMNMPGVAEGNWAWRCSPQQLASASWQRLKQLTVQSSRLAKSGK